jgi:hypothetical protein
MVNNLIQQGQPRGLMPISNVFANAPVEDLGEGIRSALGQLSIMGNIFSIRYRGVVEQLPPQQARQVEIVILKSAKTQGKSFWPGGFKGDNVPPTCWSSNSLTPDAQVPADQVQSKTCATCPNDAFVTAANGMKQKPCGDHKRLAMVPIDDPVNEAYGGPMIFRVPAGSLGALDKYGNELKKFGIPYYAYTTLVTLTLQNNVTKLTFEPGRPLNDEEALIVKELRENEKSGRIVNEALPEFEGEDVTSGVTTPPKAATAIPITQPAKAAPAAATVTPINRPVPPVQTTATINAAVSKPATPPTSQRTVITEIAEETVIEENAEVPDEMDALFGDLNSRS